MGQFERDPLVRRTLLECVLLAALCGVGGLVLARWLMESARGVLGR